MNNERKPHSILNDLAGIIVVSLFLAVIVMGFGLFELVRFVAELLP